MKRTRLRLRVCGMSSVCGRVRQGMLLVYPFSVSVNLWLSPSTSKILIVLSEEQVASRRP